VSPYPLKETLTGFGTFSENEFGLVTATKLRSWIDNWPANRPSGITGNLVVVLYYPSGSYTKKYLLPSQGVFVYDWTSSVYNQTDRFAYRTNRNNGLIKDPNALPTGATTDSILQTFGIDPTRDLVVFALGSDPNPGTSSSPKGSGYMFTGRSLYWLRAWGVAKENLALLNGAIDANQDFPASYPTTDAGNLSVPTRSNFSVKQLRARDNFVLTQSIEDIIDLIKNPSSHSVVGVGRPFFADARYNESRSDSEYLGNPSTNTGGQSGPALFAGHIKTARFTPWPSVIDQTTGKFKSKAAIDALWANTNGWYSGNSQGDGVGQEHTIVSYCRTNARSMVSGLSAFLISGLPVVFYENSMIEWTALSANHPNETLRTLPAGQRFAVDSADLTESSPGNGPVYNSSATTTQYSSFEINRNATTSKLNLIEDRAYKLR